MQRSPRSWRPWWHTAKPNAPPRSCNATSATQATGNGSVAGRGCTGNAFAYGAVPGAASICDKHMKYITTVDDKDYLVEIIDEKHISVNGKTYQADFESVSGQPVYSLIVDGKSHESYVQQ